MNALFGERDCILQYCARDKQGRQLKDWQPEGQHIFWPTTLSLRRLHIEEYAPDLLRVLNQNLLLRRHFLSVNMS